jgi:hypothetical protein
MKDRLKELMNQTGVPTSIPFDQWCEKFTELIVKECIDTLEWHGVDNGVPYIEYMAKSKLGVMK